MSSRQSILYLTYDGLTDDLGRSQIIPYLNGLADHGYRITVISFDKKSKYEARKKKVSASLNELITWKSLRYHKRPPLLSTFYDLRKLDAAVESLYSEQEFQFIHVRSYPPMDAALLMKEKFGSKVIFDMRGFYADERIDGKIWSLSNPLHKFLFQRLKSKEKTYLKEADAIVSLTDKGKEILTDRHSINKDKIHVIPCCADFKHFSPQDQGKNSDMTIVYLGSLGTWYLTDELLRIYSMILRDLPKTRLRVISNDDPTPVKEGIVTYGLDPSRVEIGGVEKEDLPSELSRSDIAVFFIRPSFSKQASSPTKLGELLACGIPVIANKGVGDLELHAESLSGLEVVDTDIIEQESLLKSVDQLLTTDSSVIRKEAYDKYSLDMGIKKYLDVYRSLIDNLSS